MKLTIEPRNKLKKGDTNQIRREGNVPGVLYGQGRENQNIVIRGEELKGILRNLKSGLLPTTVFQLADGHHSHRAIVKDIHYHTSNYSVLHVDFAILEEKRPVTVNVPIQIAGIGDCTGIKLGGFLRHIIRTLKVKCLPKNIPQEFILDIRDLNILQSKRLSDIAIPDGVTPLARMDEVAVVIAKR